MAWSPKVFTFIVALVLLAAIACGGEATRTPAGPTSGQTAQTDATSPPPKVLSGKPVNLRVGTVADTYRNDPNDLSRLNIGMFPLNVNIFDQLLLVDHNFQLQPMLAESWEYIEETGSWRFDLREDVKFHDGQPFTAQAVVEMVQRFWSQGVGIYV